VEASLVAVVLAADGLLAFGFGAPGWLAALYVALGLALATLWLRVRSRRPRVAPSPPPALSPAPEPAASEPGARRALGYVCLGDGPAADGLAGQRSAIREWCGGHGVELATVVHDSEANDDGHSRPSLRWALEQIANRQADLLVVARLHDLSANLANLPPLLSWFTEPGRSLVALDVRMDTATDAGRIAAQALEGVGGWERDRISERTRRGLEAARQRGGGQGRTAVADVPELHERIAAMREQGMTLQSIADTLNEEGVPTVGSDPLWRPWSVREAGGAWPPRGPARRRPRP
jgi:DNA invertase Pin-like site-specific DNA recombinase